MSKSIDLSSPRAVSAKYVKTPVYLHAHPTKPTWSVRYIKKVPEQLKFICNCKPEFIDSALEAVPVLDSAVKQVIGYWTDKPNNKHLVYALLESGNLIEISGAISNVKFEVIPR